MFALDIPRRVSMIIQTSTEIKHSWHDGVGTITDLSDTDTFTKNQHHYSHLRLVNTLSVNKYQHHISNNHVYVADALT